MKNSKKLQLVSLILDSFEGVSAEEWLDKNYHKSFDNLTEHEIEMIINELNSYIKIRGYDNG